MKKYVALFLVLALSVSMLAGCSGALDKVIPPKTVTVDDLTLTLPGYYIDMSSQDWAVSMAFVYGYNNAAVLGIKESISSLEGSFPDLTATRYAELFVESNQLNSSVSEENGLVSFTYTASVDNMDITYLCGVFKGTDNFWVVQCYCASEDFSNMENDFRSILTSVPV